MTSRSKFDIMMEAWGTTDLEAIDKIVMTRVYAPAPPRRTFSKLKLPYTAPSCPPLPSWTEIDHATKKNSLQHEKYGNAPICRIGDTVVKYNASHDILEEAENLIFLAEKRPQLRIPTLYAIWAAEIEGHGELYFMMMSFIDGVTLTNDVFVALPEKTQDIICTKVSAQIRYLRELPSEGYYGRVHRQGWVTGPTCLEVDTAAHKSVHGPYNTYEEFCSVIYRAYELAHAAQGRGTEWHPVHMPNMLKLQSVMQGWDPHEPKFTWIDPKLMNMVARPIKGDDGNEDWEVYLIDWECCGWYPAWVQSLRFKQSCFAYTVSEIIEDSLFPEMIDYRTEDIQRQILKDFDPNPDQERPQKLRELDWPFF